MYKLKIYRMHRLAIEFEVREQNILRPSGYFMYHWAYH